MSATTEKMLTLKKVPLFAETPDDVLAEVVPLLEELTFQVGETIFHKGDPGTSMYIIVEGEVRVHDEDMDLNFLGKGAVFGEMSALDPEPRSASVTVVETVRLFQLEQAALYGLMERRFEVVHGIVHILCQHLRNRMRDLREDFTYMQQFARVTSAAVAVESGVFEPESLDEVAMRTDELGQLARVFQRMTREVYAREQRLKQQVNELRIEVDSIKAERQVAEITETDYFKTLQETVRQLRKEPGENEGQ
jgi:CRP-like cAMP-binding protein